MIALREAGQQVAGHIVYTELPIETAGGVIRAAAHACVDAVVVVGDAAYYTRFGFAPELAATLQSPIPPGDHFLAMELSPGSIEGCGGRVRYARAFGL